MGRPSKLTDELKEIVIRKLRGTGNIQRACLAAHITATTYYDWRKRAEIGEEPYASFFEDIDVALADYESELGAKAATKSPEWFLTHSCLRDNWHEHKPMPSEEERPTNINVTITRRPIKEDDGNGHQHEP